MRLGIESYVTVPQAIVSGLRSSQDPRNEPSLLSHKRAKHCESLCLEATIEGIILLTDQESSCRHHQYSMSLSVSCQWVEQGNELCGCLTGCLFVCKYRGIPAWLLKGRAS
jgi:hypothetical protein